MKKEALAKFFWVFLAFVMLLGQTIADGAATSLSTVTQVEQNNGVAAGQVTNEENEPGRYMTLPGTNLKVFVPEVVNTMNPADVVEIEKKSGFSQDNDPKARITGLKAEDKALKQQVADLTKVAENQGATILSLNDKLKVRDAQIEELNAKLKNLNCSATTGSVDIQVEQLLKEKQELAQDLADEVAFVDKCESKLESKKAKSKELRELWRQSLTMDNEDLFALLRENDILDDITEKGVDGEGKNWTYTGEAWDNVSWGEGNVTYSDGYSYSGEWKEDAQWGYGIAKWPDGSTYEGEFEDDVRSGLGEFTASNGYSYEGEYEDGKPEGRGIMNGADGSYYDGDWSKGMFNGNGTMYFADGRIYTGEWVENQPQGEGDMIYPSGDHFIGDWKNGEIWGDGKMKFDNGQVYDGEWQNNKFWGKGTYTWPDGKEYEGEFKEDKFDGIGKLKLADGTIQKGIFEKGVYKGPASQSTAPVVEPSSKISTGNSVPDHLFDR
jgi:hypothetical protein